MHTLVETGNTVIVIEHNLEVIKTADWIIDLGPEGGDKGGKLVAQDTPEDVAAVKSSFTGQYLKPYLKRRQRTSKKASPPAKKKKAAANKPRKARKTAAAPQAS